MVDCWLWSFANLLVKVNFFSFFSFHHVFFCKVKKKKDNEENPLFVIFFVSPLKLWKTLKIWFPFCWFLIQFFFWILKLNLIDLQREKKQIELIDRSFCLFSIADCWFDFDWSITYQSLSNYQNQKIKKRSNDKMILMKSIN